jgi:proteasome lid subunit RPN8/RPN11
MAGAVEFIDVDADVDAAAGAPRRSGRPRRAPPTIEFDAGLSPHTAPTQAESRRGAKRSSKTKSTSAAGALAAVETDDAKDRLDQTVPLTPGVSAGAPAIQPYRVSQHPCASALMHLHAHMAETEVIGYLGGFVVSGKDRRAVAGDDRASEAKIAADDDIRLETKMRATSAPGTTGDAIHIAASRSAAMGKTMLDANLTPVAAATAVVSTNRNNEEDALYAAAVPAVDAASAANAAKDKKGAEDADTTIYIMEAFPARCVEAKVLAKTGRDAFSEVEMDPESDVEVRTRIVQKGMSIVGWYHSHPFFSTDPSEVDVENQHNYQTLLFGGAPYVAAIVTPYWECLPDWRGKIDLFYVQTENLTPVALDYSNSAGLPPMNPSTTYYYAAASTSASMYSMAPREGVPLESSSTDGVVPLHRMNAEMLPYQLASLENEAMNLISHYSQYTKRIDLLSYWRDQMTCLEKLRRTICDHNPPPSPSLSPPQPPPPHLKSTPPCQSDTVPSSARHLDPASPLPSPRPAGSSVVDGTDGDNFRDGDAEQRFCLSRGNAVKGNNRDKEMEKGQEKGKIERSKKEEQDEPVVFIKHPFREYPATPEIDMLLESLIEQAGAAWVVSGKEREERAAELAAKRSKGKRRKKFF